MDSLWPLPGEGSLPDFRLEEPSPVQLRSWRHWEAGGEARPARPGPPTGRGVPVAEPALACPCPRSAAPTASPARPAARRGSASGYLSLGRFHLKSELSLRHRCPGLARRWLSAALPCSCAQGWHGFTWWQCGWPRPRPLGALEDSAWAHASSHDTLTCVAVLWGLSLGTHKVVSLASACLEAKPREGGRLAGQETVPQGPSRTPAPQKATPQGPPFWSLLDLKSQLPPQRERGRGG